MRDELEHTWRWISNQFNLKFPDDVASVSLGLKRDSEKHSRQVAQYREAAGAQFPALKLDDQDMSASGEGTTAVQYEEAIPHSKDVV